MITEKQHQEWKKDLIELHKVEVENGKLRDALIDIGESLRTKMEIHRPEPSVKPTWFCFLQEERFRLEVLIDKALDETSLDARIQQSQAKHYLKTKTFYYLCKESERIYRGTTPFESLYCLRSIQSSSCEHALRHEGYSIEEVKEQECTCLRCALESYFPHSFRNAAVRAEKVIKATKG